MNELINLGNGAMVKMTMLKGEQGSSISSIAKTSTEGLVDTYTITLTDGSTKTFTVTNGKTIESIAKTDTTGLVDTYTITFNDNTTSTFTVTNGKGISSIAKTTTVGLVDTYTITFNDGTTSTFDVTNGANGVGISSIAKTDTTGLVDTYTITYTNGQTTTFTVTNGANGQDVANSNLAPVETTSTASQSYSVGQHLIYNGIYYVVTQAIASGDTIAVGVNISQNTVSSEIESLNKIKITLQTTTNETYASFFNRIDQAISNTGLSRSNFILIFDDEVFTLDGSFYTKVKITNQGDSANFNIYCDSIVLQGTNSYWARNGFRINSGNTISNFSHSVSQTDIAGNRTCVLSQI